MAMNIYQQAAKIMNESIGTKIKVMGLKQDKLKAAIKDQYNAKKIKKLCAPEQASFLKAVLDDINGKTNVEIVPPGSKSVSPKGKKTKEEPPEDLDPDDDEEPEEEEPEEEEPEEEEPEEEECDCPAFGKEYDTEAEECQECEWAKRCAKATEAGSKKKAKPKAKKDAKGTGAKPKKKDGAPSNKEVVYKAWKKGTKDTEALSKLVGGAVKDSTIRGWVSAWGRGTNLPACATK